MPFTTLRYHIVTATKNRAPFLVPEVELALYTALPQIVIDAGGHLCLANGDVDHMHVVTAIRPRVSVSGFVRDVKSMSSTLLREQFPALGFWWQSSFSAFSVSPHDMRALMDYVRNQKEHHRAGTTTALWELLDS